MEKNNHSFIRALIEFLQMKVDSKPTYGEVTLLEKREKNNGGYGFVIKFNDKK